MASLDRQAIRVVWAQMRRRERMTEGELAKKVQIRSSDLAHWLHRDQPLPDDEHNRLISFFKVRMEEAGRKGHPYVTSASELRKVPGFGSRVGSETKADPFVAEVGGYIREQREQHGRSDRRIGEEIGVSHNLVGSVRRGEGKAVYPETRDKLKKWYDREKRKPEPPEQQELPDYGTSGGVKLTEEVVDKLADEAEKGYEPEQLRERKRAFFPVEDELSAIGKLHQISPEARVRVQAYLQAMIRQDHEVSDKTPTPRATGFDVDSQRFVEEK